MRKLSIRSEWAIGVRRAAETLLELGRPDLAQRLLQPASRLEGPDKRLARERLAETLLKLGRAAEAIALQRKIIAEDPQNWDARRALAATLFGQQDYGEVSAILSTAPPERADAVDVLWDLCFSRLYGPDRNVHDYVAASKRWWRVAVGADRSVIPMRRAKLADGRKLRVGYAQPHFHFEAYAVGALSAVAAHDRNRFEVFGYDFGPETPPRPQRVLSMFDHYHMMHGLSDAEAAARIAADEIDVLVDMTGFDPACPVGVYKHRPAPILVSWANGFSTFGGPLFDYIIGDDIVSPPDEDHLYSEKIYRVPTPFIQFDVSKQLERPSAPPPVVKNGFITFGCFNRPYKLNIDTAMIWSEIMRRVPDSLLFLRSASYQFPYQRTRVMRLLSDAGVRPGRIRLMGYGEHDEFMASFDQVDIALDPLGFGGALSTVDALSRGTPVITLRGERWPSRFGASFLSACGMAELIASTEADYVERACALATDRERLVRLRREIPAALGASPLGDLKAGARALESAYVQMINEAAL